MSLLFLPNDDELDQIEGWLSLDEGRRLAFLAWTVPAHLAIVELGSWKGKSTAWLASGSRLGNRARVFAVDHWVGSEEHRHLFWEPGASTFPEFKANMAWLGLEDLVTPISGRTVEVAATWDRAIGLLFIDAAHDYESVRADFLAWSPFVVRGGWVAFHDASAPGVSQVIREFVEGSGEWLGDSTWPPWAAKRL
ncbi:MAG: class I SAM-dependent methyltransferase [Firmicutes bacterium]|nr:class I SAM-dependent methyltransferase [Bacillota bacterium]